MGIAPALKFYKKAELLIEGKSLKVHGIECNERAIFFPGELFAPLHQIASQPLCALCFIHPELVDIERAEKLCSGHAGNEVALIVTDQKGKRFNGRHSLFFTGILANSLDQLAFLIR